LERHCADAVKSDVVRQIITNTGSTGSALAHNRGLDDDAASAQNKTNLNNGCGKR
jgi:hypothetical protein